MAIAKYVMGNKGAFNNVFDKFCAPYYKEQMDKEKVSLKKLEEETGVFKECRTEIDYSIDPEPSVIEEVPTI